MKFLVVNQYNSDNLGDKLLNEMLCLNIMKLGHEYVNAGFAQTTEQSIDYDKTKKKDIILRKIKKKIHPLIKYILIYKKRINTIQKKEELLKCDAIIIGGGQLLKHNSVFLFCMLNWIKYAKKRRIPILIYGISVDLNINHIEKFIYKKIIKAANTVNVRDLQTAKLMKRYFNTEALVSPDIAFSYYDYIIQKKVDKENNNILILPYDSITAKFSFNNKETKLENYKKIISLINQENKDSKKQSIILTATTSSDLSECYELYNYLIYNGYEAKIIKSKNIDELKELVLNCKELITGRMHAMILGMICQKKVKPIIISNKIEVFKNEYLDNEKINIEEISRKATEGLENSLKILLK